MTFPCSLSLNLQCQNLALAHVKMPDDKEWLNTWEALSLSSEDSFFQGAVWKQAQRPWKCTALQSLCWEIAQCCLEAPNVSLVGTYCFGLAWINARCPPKLHCHSPPQLDRGEDCGFTSVFFLPLLKYVITEALPLSLIGLALASGGFILEPSGTGFITHGGSFSQLLTETTPIAPLLPKPCHTYP